MNIISGSKTDLPHGLHAELGTYRHGVFVDLLRWDLDAPNGIEQDQFDRQDTLYIIARNAEGGINGCARLLPTTKPYLLGEVFPQLLNGMDPPHSEEIWELSRFAAVDLNKAGTPATHQLSSPIAIGLLNGVIHCAKTLGAKRLITVSPIGIERLLRHAGFRAHRAGPPMVLGGHPLFACWIEVNGQ